jgi:DNA-binding MarR family transcriptional regulator
MAQSFDFHQAPGHLVRRAHQRAVALFMEETAGFDVTPVQFAILNELIDQPGADQVTLAARVALDAATSGSVIGRLEARGWIRRVPDSRDRRRKLLWVTPAGEAAALQLRPAAQRVQERLMAPLSQAEVTQLKSLLAKLVCGPAAPGNASAPHLPLSALPPLSSP